MYARTCSSAFKAHLLLTGGVRAESSSSSASSSGDTCCREAAISGSERSSVVAMDWSMLIYSPTLRPVVPTMLENLSNKLVNSFSGELTLTGFEVGEPVSDDGSNLTKPA
ncbi:hypothetical protein RRG08_028702 [Elysia crispata]|uniref:Uncharacterized protein n=1 Tax=Elysia crispata TaxID=231223 RepID=A0AAE0XP15_9GAST|nr:hypothetical protein RRG08_028702 [Elysia crispata]